MKLTGKKIIISGASGYLAQWLGNYFSPENEVIFLSRMKVRDKNNRIGSPCPPPGQTLYWDGRSLEDGWTAALEGADLLLNLSGKSVNDRYGHRVRQEIWESRVQSTTVLAEAVRRCKMPPAVWMNASSATIYRHSTDQVQDEYSGDISRLRKDNMPRNPVDQFRNCIRRLRHSLRKTDLPAWDFPFAYDFSVEVCRAWEEAFFRTELPETRRIALRMAIVLGPGGALAPFLQLVRRWKISRLGNGKQMFSWVHIRDLALAMEWIFSHPDLSGPVNIAAPDALTNQSFLELLGERSGTKPYLPVASSLLELGAFFGRTETELILKSRWVASTRLQESGFSFRFPRMQDALADLLDEKGDFRDLYARRQERDIRMS